MPGRSMRLEAMPLVGGLSLLLLHRNAGPVGHLQIRTCKSIKKRRFSTVWIAHKRHCQFFFHLSQALLFSDPYAAGDLPSHGPSGSPHLDDTGTISLPVQNPDLCAFRDPQCFQPPHDLILYVKLCHFIQSIHCTIINASSLSPVFDCIL